MFVARHLSLHLRTMPMRCTFSSRNSTSISPNKMPVPSLVHGVTSGMSSSGMFKLMSKLAPGPSLCSSSDPVCSMTADAASCASCASNRAISCNLSSSVNPPVTRYQFSTSRSSEAVQPAPTTGEYSSDEDVAAQECDNGCQTTASYRSGKLLLRWTNCLSQDTYKMPTFRGCNTSNREYHRMTRSCK